MRRSDPTPFSGACQPLGAPARRVGYFGVTSNLQLVWPMRYLNHWSSFAQNCPQNKFWLGFIPGYGWPGYLQVKSAIDAKNRRTNDGLTFRE